MLMILSSNNDAKILEFECKLIKQLVLNIFVFQETTHTLKIPTPTPAPDRGGPVACLGGPVACLGGP